jgi:hypothetical protein
MDFVQTYMVYLTVELRMELIKGRWLNAKAAFTLVTVVMNAAEE